jgi:predicted thioesterase
MAATPVGLTVRSEARLTGVDGRRLIFDVRAWDDQGLIGEGEHERFIIDMDAFEAKARQKQADNTRTAQKDRQ